SLPTPRAPPSLLFPSTTLFRSLPEYSKAVPNRENCATNPVNQNAELRVLPKNTIKYTPFSKIQHSTGPSSVQPTCRTENVPENTAQSAIISPKAEGRFPSRIQQSSPSGRLKMMDI